MNEIFGLTVPQITIFAILIITICLFIWDKWRFDLVALGALFVSVIAGVVSPEDAFSGIGDPVVVTVGCILVMSAAISRSGFIDWCMKLLSHVVDKPKLQIALLVTLVVSLSAFMNNVGALAVFLPIAIAFAKKAQRSPSELLMPLSFGSLLGGLITLIGTPPNILISRIRQDITGAPFEMFDFAPVGLGVCAVGIAYLTVGWKFLPKDRRGQPAPEDRFTIEDYISEVRVPEESTIIGKTVHDVEMKMQDEDFAIIGLIRNKYRRLVPSGRMKILAGDILVVETDPIMLKKLIDTYGLALTEAKQDERVVLDSDDVGVMEAIITQGSILTRTTARALALRSRFGVNLLAVRKSGAAVKKRIRDIKLAEGDVIVLQGNLDEMPQTLSELGALPLAERNLLLGRGKMAFLPVLIMAIAIGLTVAGILPISIAFLGGVVAIGALRVLRMHEMYDAIDAPVIILLAAMIPVSQALSDTGGADVIADVLSSVTAGLTAPMIVASVIIASMMVTPFLNNGATVLLMAPIAAGLATRMDMSVDPFLMAVAIGTSCDFLTPVGHQSNTLVMGPGGYRFNDYWRMGLPLSILVIIVATPLILWVWPV